MSRLEHCDVFYISYDEPRCDEFWQEISARIPQARRVHGVKGFDAAYKTCAQLSRTPRFFTIDGDNRLQPAFFDLTLDLNTYPADAVVSFSARNSVNGLVYGNGGVKNWPTALALTMRTHEAHAEEETAVDFCFRLNYHRHPEVLSHAEVHGSPYQAFRAGFREGVKMCMERGKRPALPREARAAAFREHVALFNRNRLRIWCSVGLDQENGAWAMLGARLGAKMLCLTDWNHHLIRDYDWFAGFWREQIEPEFRENLAPALARLETELNEELGLEIATFGPRESAFFKSVYVGPALSPGPILPPLPAEVPRGV